MSWSVDLLTSNAVRQLNSDRFEAMNNAVCAALYYRSLPDPQKEIDECTLNYFSSEDELNELRRLEGAYKEAKTAFLDYKSWLMNKARQSELASSKTAFDSYFGAK